MRDDKDWDFIGDIVNEVAKERERQDVRWGEQNHPDLDRHFRTYDAVGACERAKKRCEDDVVSGTTNWRNILDEEVQEAFEQAAFHDDESLRAELVQVAAVAAAWIECIDRRKP